MNDNLTIFGHTVILSLKILYLYRVHFCTWYVMDWLHDMHFSWGYWSLYRDIVHIGKRYIMCLQIYDHMIWCTLFRSKVIDDVTEIMCTFQKESATWKCLYLYPAYIVYVMIWRICDLTWMLCKCQKVTLVLYNLFV